MGMLKDGVTWLVSKTRAKLSDTIEYRRAGVSISIPALLGQTTYEVADEDGMIVESKAIAFLVAKSDMVLLGSPILPEMGDQIRIVQGADTVVYEVLNLGGAGHWRPSGPHNLMFRIYTKHMGTE